MSDALTPSQDAKARIQALGQKALLAFFEEVSTSAMQQVARGLPSIDGFRKTSQAGIAKQKETLARKLSRPGANDRDYHGLYLIWRSWIAEKLPNAELVHELIDDVEDAADEVDSPDVRTTVIEKNVDALLGKLRDESQHNNCTREQIERLFTFSPFPETVAARGLIAGAKTAMEVGRDTQLDELPKRLRHDEDEIRSIKAELKTLSASHYTLAVSVEPVVGKLPALESVVAEAKALAESARNTIQEQAARATNPESTQPSEKSDDALVAVEARVAALASQSDELTRELGKLSSTVSGVRDLREAIDRLDAVQKNSQDHSRNNARHTEELSAAIQKITGEFSALKEDRQLADRLAALGERLGALEERTNVATPNLAVPTGTKEIETYQSGRVLDLRAGLNWEALQRASGKTFTPIRSHSDIANAFAKVVQLLGLRKTTGQIFAEECAAAVVSRQAIFLKGAFAARVARGLARAIGGAGSGRLAVPIGLQDGEELRFCIGAALGRHTESVGALAVEGINRTALDVTKEVLADCIDVPSNAMDGLAGRVAIFATITSGIASLPIEPSYFELGPVFDLDYLDWRTNPSGDQETAATNLPIDVYRAIQEQLGTGEANTEEALRLARLFQQRKNPAVERIIARAYRALHIVRSDQKVVTPLQSLAYGWLLPYWRSLGFSKEQIDSELDGGKCNGSAVDQRLAAMLRAEFADNGQADRAS
jgi:hypothetical protein